MRNLISSGDHRDAAEHFIEHVALGPGTWDRLPEPFRAVVEANAPTYLDELADPTALSIDTAALATTTVPLLLTHGTESPELFPAVIAELVKLVPAARVEVLGEPATSPTPPTPRMDLHLMAFHEQHPRGRMPGENSSSNIASPSAL